MVIWKPPALLIILGSFVLLFLGGGFLLVNALEIIPPGNRAGAVASWLWGVGIIVSDLWYRRSQAMPLLDPAASTVFFVIPTWAVGIVPILIGAQLWTKV